MKALAHVETPAAVVDLARLDANLGRWQAHCDGLGLTSRPHVKTHKCVEIAHRQVALGAAGITCQTLFEAETMVAAGIDDVLIPFNIVGTPKLARLANLLRRASVAVGVDDEALLPGLVRAAADGGRTLGVLVDCDTGLGRTGVGTPAAAAALARAIALQPGLLYLGLITYPALPAASAFLAEASEVAALSGLVTGVVSAGGTPAMWKCAAMLPTVTEYRVGTYAFHDRATVAAGAATVDEVAMTVLATVVSRPARDRAILDAGSKALTSDTGPDEGFGLVLEAPTSVVERLNEEHAYVTVAATDDLELGQRVRIVPNHACVVSNMFERFVVVDGEHVIDEWPICRGR